MIKSYEKVLSAVEVDTTRSNQHEFNGVAELQNLFGSNRFSKPASFSIRGNNKTYCTAEITWYDARENHPTRTEFRLYFQSNTVMEKAREGDSIIISCDEHHDNICFELIPQH